MHLRKLVLACGFASLALSNYASALGLGEVKLKSTLNQPLSAELQLIDTKGLSAEQIIVALASSADFERNGIDFVHFYTEFQFQVVLDNPGGPIVRITSRNPVREPYLNFLVEAKWTSGRVIHEYTLLMDLPTYDDAAPQAVQPAQTTKAKVTTETPAAQPKVSAPAVQPAAVSSNAPEEKPDIIAEQDQSAKKSKISSGTYGPVGSKDTLWDIALAVRPDSSASVHQTMLALQRLNPDAFIHGNINLIKKGQVLRVPDATEINSVSKTEAVRQVNNQIAEWSGGSNSSTTMGAQLDASRHSSTEHSKSEPVSGRVKLEAPSANKASGQGSGANKGSGRALESELASAMEELDKAKSEKTELSSRVHELEDQVKTMQRLVDVSNEKLRAMQLNAAKQDQKIADQTAVKTSEVKSAAVQSSVVSSAQATSSSAATEKPVSERTAEDKSAAEKKPAPKPANKPLAKVEPEKSLLDMAFDNIQWIGLGALGLLVLGFVAVRRRKAQAEEAQASHHSDELFESEPNFDAFHHEHPEDEEHADAVDEMALFEEEDTSAVAETGDVVGEADIYIAYGKYDQAEEMLLNGLAKDPANTDIRLKLLEVYSQTRNLSEFDKHYAAILPLATGFALTRAAELRAAIPGAGEFVAGTTPTAQSTATDLESGFALDDVASSYDSPKLATDDDFNFDLDLDAEPDSDLDTTTTNYGMDFDEKATQQSSLTTPDDDFALDFDLDDIDSAGDASAAEDLSDISLALDNLDHDELPDDIEIPSAEDEFSFDFDEVDAEPSTLSQEVDSIRSAQLNEDDNQGDDFNLEMDVDDVDLAALDNEMASLDAELDSLDDDPVAVTSAGALNTNLDDDFANLDKGFADDNEGFVPAFSADAQADEESLDFESLDDELAALDTEPEAATEEFTFPDDVDFDDAELNDLELADTELDDAVAGHEFASEEFELEGDDFDIDASADASMATLDDLSLETSGLDEQVVDEPLHDSVVESTAFDLGADNDFEVSNSAAVGEEDLDVLAAENHQEEAEPEVAFDAATADDEEVAPLPLPTDEDIAEDDLFEQALSDFSAEGLAMDDAADISDDDMDAELDFMADADEAATKLDLARAYIDMGDNDGARDILAEVAHEGNEQQRQEAVDLLSRIDV